MMFPCATIFKSRFVDVAIEMILPDSDPVSGQLRLEDGAGLAPPAKQPEAVPRLMDASPSVQMDGGALGMTASLCDLDSAENLQLELRPRSDNSARAAVSVAPGVRVLKAPPTPSPTKLKGRKEELAREVTARLGTAA